MTGLYIHIPFCASRCIYCGFYSTTLGSQLSHRYVGALCREMALRPTTDLIQTIYLGGGTPSQLAHGDLEMLFNNIYKVYRVAPDAEVTMECNPDDVRPGLLSHLPVNRMSMGAQTFSDDRLRFLHRRHTAAEVDHAVALLRHDGINNISLDLMFGFPGETLADWLADIDHCLALQPDHISAYGLMVEEGTPLYRMVEAHEVSEIDEDLSLEMYDVLINRLTAAGYEHYEISNFARPGRRSRHNTSYWNDTPYIGIGAAAHSYSVETLADGSCHRERNWNPSDIRRYLASIEASRLPLERDLIDADTHYDDIVTTALRTREGIRLSSLDDDHRRFLLQAADAYVRRGLLRFADGHLSLTREGISISNTIMSDLMDV